MALGNDYNTQEYKDNLEKVNAALNADIPTTVIDAETGLPRELTLFEKAQYAGSNLLGGIAASPMTFLSEFIFVEGVQEIAPLLIGGGAANVALKAGQALNVSTKAANTLATATGVTAATLLDVGEAMGGAASDAYDQAFAECKLVLEQKNALLPEGAKMSDAMITEICSESALEVAHKIGKIAGVGVMAALPVSAGINASIISKVINGKVGSEIQQQSLTKIIQEFGAGGAIAVAFDGVTEGIQDGYTQFELEKELHKINPNRDTDPLAQSLNTGFLSAVIGTGVSTGIQGTVFAHAVNQIDTNPFTTIFADTPAPDISNVLKPSDSRDFGANLVLNFSPSFGTRNGSITERGVDPIAIGYDFNDTEDVSAFRSDLLNLGLSEDSVGVIVYQYTPQDVLSIDDVVDRFEANDYTPTKAEIDRFTSVDPNTFNVDTTVSAKTERAYIFNKDDGVADFLDNVNNSAFTDGTGDLYTLFGRTGYPNQTFEAFNFHDTGDIGDPAAWNAEENFGLGNFDLYITDMDRMVYNPLGQAQWGGNTQSFHSGVADYASAGRWYLGSTDPAGSFAVQGDPNQIYRGLYLPEVIGENEQHTATRTPNYNFEGLLKWTEPSNNLDLLVNDVFTVDKYAMPARTSYGVLNYSHFFANDPGDYENTLGYVTKPDLSTFPKTPEELAALPRLQNDNFYANSPDGKVVSPMNLPGLLDGRMQGYSGGRVHLEYAPYRDAVYYDPISKRAYMLTAVNHFKTEVRGGGTDPYFPPLQPSSFDQPLYEWAVLPSSTITQEMLGTMGAESTPWGMFLAMDPNSNLYDEANYPGVMDINPAALAEIQKADAHIASYTTFNERHGDLRTPQDLITAVFKDHYYDPNGHYPERSIHTKLADAHRAARGIQLQLLGRVTNYQDASFYSEADIEALTEIGGIADSLRDAIIDGKSLSNNESTTTATLQNIDDYVDPLALSAQEIVTAANDAGLNIDMRYAETLAGRYDQDTFADEDAALAGILAIPTLEADSQQYVETNFPDPVDPLIQTAKDALDDATQDGGALSSASGLYDSLVNYFTDPNGTNQNQIEYNDPNTTDERRKELVQASLDARRYSQAEILADIKTQLNDNRADNEILADPDYASLFALEATKGGRDPVDNLLYGDSATS